MTQFKTVFEMKRSKKSAKKNQMRISGTELGQRDCVKYSKKSLVRKLSVKVFFIRDDLLHFRVFQDQN